MPTGATLAALPATLSVLAQADGLRSTTRVPLADWLAWLEGLSAERVPARGKRAPGGKGDKVIEDAPGRYVATR